MKDHGILHQLTLPYNPAQNGVTERMNRTVMDPAPAMMSHACLLPEFWAEAVNTSVYLPNRSPTSGLNGVTPFECLFKQKSDVCNLRLFGCIGYVHIPDVQRTKLDAKSRRSIFVGHPEGAKGYKLYDPSSKKDIRSRDVVFQEKKFYGFGIKQSTLRDHEDIDELPDAINVPVIENSDHKDDDRNADNLQT